jgi:hypothetical protein
MAYTIAQDQEQAKLAVGLQQKSEIVSIRLIESTARCKVPFGDEEPTPLSFSAEFHPEAVTLESANLKITIQFSFRISDKANSDIVFLKCLLDADYRLSEGYQPTPEQVNAFKDGPAIFNCWPYFREYVQNTVIRMNYPPPTIPFLWLVIKPKQVANPATLVDHPVPKAPQKKAARRRRDS